MKKRLLTAALVIGLSALPPPPKASAGIFDDFLGGIFKSVPEDLITYFSGGSSGFDPFNLGNLISNPTSIVQYFESYLGNLKNLAIQNITSLIGGYLNVPIPVLGGNLDLSPVLNAALGKMGVFDPVEIDSSLPSLLPDFTVTAGAGGTQVAGATDTSFLPLGAAATALEPAKIAANNATLQTTLGIEGQDTMVRSKASALNSYTGINTAAREAATSSVTQDVMKKIAEQQNGLGSIAQLTFEEAQQTRVVGALSASQLVELNDKEQKKTWAEKIERTADNTGLYKGLTEFSSSVRAGSGSLANP